MVIGVESTITFPDVLVRHPEAIDTFPVAVDCAVFGLDDEGLKVLLIQRDLPPHQGVWALPGGFVRAHEHLEEAARRELREEAGPEGVYLEQVAVFDGLGRDPRGRVFSVAYYALVNIRDHRIRAATDARNVRWVLVTALPPLAFDHEGIIRVALDRLRERVRRKPVGFELLPPKFTLTQLQHLYEAVLGVRLDKRNFRRKIARLGILKALDEKETGVAHRAARLYAFDQARYDRLTKEGLEVLI